MRPYFSLILLTALIVAAFPAGAADIAGTVYHDGNSNAGSFFHQEMDAKDLGLPGIDVFLYDGTNEFQTQTDGVGDFIFAGVSPGVYLVSYGMDGYECTSHNRPLRTPQAIREGALIYVHFGDSIGVYGPTIQFPDRIVTYLEQLSAVTLHNVAVGGSTSWQWLPGAAEAYWEDRLLPVLPQADLVTFTLVGNDLTPYVEGMPPYDVWQIVVNFFNHPEYVFEALPRINQIIDEIQAVNPNCDIVYVLYPNVVNSTAIQDIVGVALQPIAAALMEVVIGYMRFDLGQQDNIILADMTAMMGDEWMDPYLIDEVHVTDEGAQKYAECIFQTLGGIHIQSAGKLGEHGRLAGFYAQELAPADDDDDDIADDDDNDVSDDDDDDASDDDDDDDIADDDDAGDAGSSDDDDNDSGGCGC